MIVSVIVSVYLFSAGVKVRWGIRTEILCAVLWGLKVLSASSAVKRYHTSYILVRVPGKVGYRHVVPGRVESEFPSSNFSISIPRVHRAIPEFRYHFPEMNSGNVLELAFLA